MSAPDEREDAIFQAALYLPAEQRAAYLQRACCGDLQLQERLRARLQPHQQGDAPALSCDSTGSTMRITASALITEGPGTVIGRYKILEKVGEGGFGVVYVAEQREAVKRRVALKILKLGMDTRQVVARFEAERQALALMDHPNIAKVLDAGATGTGRPYCFVRLGLLTKRTQRDPCVAHLLWGRNWQLFRLFNPKA